MATSKETALVSNNNNVDSLNVSELGGVYSINRINKRREYLNKISQRISNLSDDKLIEVFERVENFLAPPIVILDDEKLLSPPKVLWKNRDRAGGLSVVEFIISNYNSRLGKGFTRAHLKAVDSDLYDRFSQWLAYPKNSMPANLDLPTVQEWNDRLFEATISGREIVYPDDSSKRKFAAAAYRR